jgi:DNA-binding transcriptional MocR family regulator
MYGTETYGMSQMPSWRPRIVDSAPMKYLGIVEALEADMRAGRIRPGDRLPPHRAIAETLNVDLTTVTRAFNEARRRGLVDAQAGRGTFISDDFDPGRSVGGPGAASPIRLSMNAPPQPQAADFPRLFPKAIGELLSCTIATTPAPSPIGKPPRCGLAAGSRVSPPAGSSSAPAPRARSTPFANRTCAPAT